MPTIVWLGPAPFLTLSSGIQTHFLLSQLALGMRVLRAQGLVAKFFFFCAMSSSPCLACGLPVGNRSAVVLLGLLELLFACRERCGALHCQKCFVWGWFLRICICRKCYNLLHSFHEKKRFGASHPEYFSPVIFVFIKEEITQWAVNPQGSPDLPFLMVLQTLPKFR